MKKILLSFLMIPFVIGCSNDRTASAGNSESKSADESSSTVKNVISFKVNGAEVKTSGWNIRRFRWSNQPSVWMNITSDMHKEKRTISVNLNAAKPGTYNFDGSGVVMEKSHGSYHSDQGGPSTSYSIVGGSFVITDVDTLQNVINGSFSVTAKNSKGETLNITDGKIIRGTLKPGIISL